MAVQNSTLCVMTVCIEKISYAVLRTVVLIYYPGRRFRTVL